MHKKLIINVIVFLLIIFFLLFSYASIKKVTSTGLKVEITNNNKVTEQKYVSDLINLYDADNKKFNALYTNSKIVVTDKISKLEYDYIDNESSYATSYDVISLENNIKLFVGHDKFEFINDLTVGEKITVESRILGCDKVCLLRDIEYLDDAGFKIKEKSKIKRLKGV